MRSIQEFLEQCDFQNEVEIRYYKASNLHVSLLRSALKWKEKSTSDIVYLGKLYPAYIKHVKLPKEARCIETNGKFVFQEKRNVKYVRLDDKKASEATETQLTMSVDEFNRYYDTTLIRQRTRTTFYNSSMQIDCTETKILNWYPGMKGSKDGFELELEIIKYNLKEVLSIDKLITSMIQNHNEQNVLDSYYKLIGRRQFGGPLPRTLTKEKLDSGELSCGYSITDKADGLRYHLYIDDKNDGYFIGRNGSILYSSKYTRMKNSILDGEYVKDTFYVFDVVILNSKDLRESTLEQRLQSIKNTNRKHSSVPLTGNANLKLKTFYIKKGDKLYKIQNGIKINHPQKENEVVELGDAAYQIWKNKNKSFSYDLDGLIFTPLLKPYFNNFIYKWKDQDTIDFYIIKDKKDYKWYLHIAGMYNGQYSNIRFRGVGNGKFLLKKGRSEQIVINTLYREISDILEVSKEVYNKYSNNCVIEFKYENNKFVPIRDRKDKQFANGIEAVNEAWLMMKNPILVKDLKSELNNNSKSCMRPFHNEIKNELIEKYMSNKNVLDIGFGAGGDIKKYERHQIKYVTGVDIVTPQYKLPYFIKFVKVKGDMYDIKSELSKLNLKLKYEIINCQFSVHYFFRNKEVFENFMNNVDNCLVKDGHLVLTLLDGEKVLDLLNGKKQKIGKCGSREIYKLALSETPASNYGNKLDVYLSGTAYFKNASKEYIIYLKDFIKTLKQRNYNVVLSKTFESYGKTFQEYSNLLCSAEKEYSFLNTALVFKKEK